MNSLESMKGMLRRPQFAYLVKDCRYKGKYMPGREYALIKAKGDFHS